MVSSSLSSTIGGDEVWTLARNADGTYTPGERLQSRSSLPAGLALVRTGGTWDGQQLVILDLNGDEVWTLARNADGTYTPGERLQSRSSLPAGLTLVLAGGTWDGQQLVILDLNGDEVWTLARNADGTYTPGERLQSRSSLPAGLALVRTGGTWDGQQLVILDQTTATGYGRWRATRMARIAPQTPPIQELAARRHH